MGEGVSGAGPGGPLEDTWGGRGHFGKFTATHQLDAGDWLAAAGSQAAALCLQRIVVQDMLPLLVHPHW